VFLLGFNLSDKDISYFAMALPQTASAQGPILKFIDFVDDIVSVGPKFRQNMTILVTYITFGMSCLSCWHHFSDKDFSFLLTMSGSVQTLGFFLLLHKIRVRSGCRGAWQVSRRRRCRSTCSC